MAAIDNDDGGGDFPGSVGLLKLNNPLIGCDVVPETDINRKDQITKHFTSVLKSKTKI
ncbi:putative phospholipid-transporting ATPase VD [Sesbania bispinosa]|nr:putative phospholipid-transporting ATPase VD [Sesbania bispinosa]